jgi:drug/metabolite transporter (DMT)-like permease
MSFRDWLKFIGCALIWGTSFLLIRIGVADVGPFVLVTFRVLFAVIGTVIMVIAGRVQILKNPKYLAIFLFLAFTNVAIPFILISTAEQYISSGLASIMNSTVPLFTLVIASIFLKEERASLLQSVGLVLGFAGVVVLMSDKLSGGLNTSLAGILMMLVAAFCYGVSVIFARITLKGTHPAFQSLGQMGFALILVSVATLSLEPNFHLPLHPGTWVIMLILGLVNSALANILYYSLLNSVGPTKTVLVSYVFPLIAVILGILILDETFSWRMVLGGIMIVGGVVWVNSVRKLHHGSQV